MLCSLSHNETLDQNDISLSADKTSIKSNNRNKRQKLGPPQRHKISNGNIYGTGRVSVYCVGASIDIESLRAHVFRRGFGRVYLNDEKPDMVLTREIDDESVLHISNAPLFVNARQLAMSSGEASSPTWSSIPSIGTEEEDWKLDTDLKTREMLLMATQDVFYFDYGCVVFWGLTDMEEKAALTELSAFTEDPVTEAELENRYTTSESRDLLLAGTFCLTLL